MTTDTGRVAVITGAAQGIGRRTAQVLAAEGYALALLDREPVAGFEDALTSAGDVTDDEDVQAFARAADASWPSVRLGARAQ